MADDADRAGDAMEVILASQIQARKPELPYRGQCYNCGEDVPPPKKYCDEDCAEDHEWRMKLERMNRG